MTKKTALTLWLAMTAVFALRAQNASDVRYDNVQVVRTGNEVEISFKATIGSRCIGGKGQFLLTPVLYNNMCTVPLPSIAVYSRHANWMEYREKLSKKQSSAIASTSAAYRSGNSRQVSYRTTIAWQPELTNVSLNVEPVLQSSRKRQRPFPTLRITDKLFLCTDAAVATATTPPQFPETSVADSLARQYPFLTPLSHLDDKDPFAASNEHGALRIDFGRSSSTLERYYRENETALRTLASVLRRIQLSGTARIARIAITGFSGVDGLLSWNDRLAWERADAVRTFMAENTGVLFGQIHLYNGSEDWSTLRHLVEQSAEMESRYDVLRIIDTVPILSGREKRLMELAGGIPYRYMKRYLFPKLRNAAYIRVYYSVHPTSSSPGE